MEPRHYFEALYPLQDRVLRLLQDVETGFYLTGGTAASRGYLNHRFSDDLDFFANDSPEFQLWSQRIIQALQGQSDSTTEVAMRDQRFVRLVVTHLDVKLKIEMVDDVPAHVGEIRLHPTLGRLDSPENILANKVTAALDREEPKDLADIWGFCTKMGLSLRSAIEGAQSKAAGVFPADLARVLCSAAQRDWELVRWIDPPDPRLFVSELHSLGEQLLLV